jgi:adsorption protein B
VETVLDWLVPPLVAWILLSGLDDLFVLCAYVSRRRRIDATAPPPPEGVAPKVPIAIWVPLWHEDAVIERMLEHNLAALRRLEVHFFVGAYPNDPPTLRAVRAVTRRHPNVHLCVCPHDGPTSKADCLNWVHQHMLIQERRSGVEFGLVLTHDAEDLIHPDTVAWAAHLSRSHGMIQTPVLALPTPWWQATHGIYCDEFAYHHTIDMPTRCSLGGFMPSAGVGTAYRRDALQKLAEAESNRVFAPECLTEDYENGLRLHQLGVRQVFAPVRFVGGEPVATREYFPRDFRAAWKQRTRWITGIAFQTWQRHGWGRGSQAYWLWRDRKGLVGNPLSIVANLALLYGLATGWRPHAPTPVLAATALLAAIHMGARAWASGRIYGWRFALGTPVRVPLANVLNTAASVSAAYRFARARVLGQPLKWVKTEHSYPSMAALSGHNRPLGEILVAEGAVPAAKVAEALKTCPVGRRLGEHLVELGLAGWRAVYRALAVQNDLPFLEVDPRGVSRRVARTIPARLARSLRVLPVCVQEGAVEVATTEVPSEEVWREVGEHFPAPVHFRLVTPDNFAALVEEFL